MKQLVTGSTLIEMLWNTHNSGRFHFQTQFKESHNWYILLNDKQLCPNQDKFKLFIDI